MDYDTTDTTRVVFRNTMSWNGGKECVAFLLDIPVSEDRMTTLVMSYMHIGQHGEATEGFYYECKPAQPEDYADLYKELISIGYDLKIRKIWRR